jgi:hypothetical protein
MQVGNLITEPLIRFAVAALAVSQSKPKPKHHNSNRRNQQHQDRPIQSALPFFRRTLRNRIAHGAALRPGGHCRKAHQQQQHQKPRFHCHELHTELPDPYCTPNPFGGGRMRPASGKKKQYIITKQAVTEITSIHRMIAFSNFRCMK